MTCLLCRDTPSPGYQCSRCGAFTPTDPAPSNKGAHGQAVDHGLIGLARLELARRAAVRVARAEARAERDRLYAEQVAKHIQHPQSRGNGRKMLSKP